jgi:hypothetical protein
MVLKLDVFPSFQITFPGLVILISVVAPSQRVVSLPKFNFGAAVTIMDCSEESGQKESETTYLIFKTPTLVGVNVVPTTPPVLERAQSFNVDQIRAAPFKTCVLGILIPISTVLLRN